MKKKRKERERKEWERKEREREKERERRVEWRGEKHRGWNDRIFRDVTTRSFEEEEEEEEEETGDLQPLENLPTSATTVRRWQRVAGGGENSPRGSVNATLKSAYKSLRRRLLVRSRSGLKSARALDECCFRLSLFLDRFESFRFLPRNLCRRREEKPKILFLTEHGWKEGNTRGGFLQP